MAARTVLRKNCMLEHSQLFQPVVVVKAIKHLPTANNVTQLGNLSGHNRSDQHSCFAPACCHAAVQDLRYIIALVVDAGSIREELDRISQSRAFNRSARLLEFLKFTAASRETTTSRMG